MNEPFGNSEQLAQPDAAGGLNEKSGNSGQLQAEQQGAGDVLDVRAAYAIATRWRKQASEHKAGRAALIRCAEELEAALAARQAAPGGTLIGWRMIDGVRVFEVASHSGIVEPQQFVRYDDYLAASQPVKQEPAFFANRWEMEHGTADGLVAMRAGKHVKIKDFFTVPLYTAPPAPAAVPVDGWQPIETAPKSVADGKAVDGVYLLGFVPEDDLVDLKAGIRIIWWEPLLCSRYGRRGMWVSDASDQSIEVSPTHWMPLPEAPPTHPQPAAAKDDSREARYMRDALNAYQRAEKDEREGLYYIQDTRSFVGNCPMWWAPSGGGYVTRLDEAGRYSFDAAVAQNRSRETDIPWPCEEIDNLARLTVDMQHMRTRDARLRELRRLIDQQAKAGEVQP